MSVLRRATRICTHRDVRADGWGQEFHFGREATARIFRWAGNLSPLVKAGPFGVALPANVATNRKDSKMSTVAIVLIAAAAIVVLALLYLASRRRRAQELEDRRHVAAEHREEADMRRITADKEAAAADEQAAAARRQAAEAEERAQAAQRERTAATAHEEHAQEIDPDAGESDGAARTTTEADPGTNGPPRDPARSSYPESDPGQLQHALGLTTPSAVGALAGHGARAGSEPGPPGV